MSRAGTPIDNGAMESINGWLKEELFNDFKIKELLKSMLKWFFPMLVDFSSFL